VRWAAGFLVLVAVLKLGGALLDALRRRRARTFLARLDQLAASGPLDVFRDVLAHPPVRLEYFVLGLEQRAGDASYPRDARADLLYRAMPPTNDQVALRRDDPLAVFAWMRGLQRRYDENRMHAGWLIRVSTTVPKDRLDALWARALASPDPWVLPPELEVHEELP